MFHLPVLWDFGLARRCIARRPHAAWLAPERRKFGRLTLPNSRRSGAIPGARTCLLRPSRSPTPPELQRRAETGEKNDRRWSSRGKVRLRGKERPTQACSAWPGRSTARLGIGIMCGFLMSFRFLVRMRSSECSVFGAGPAPKTEMRVILPRSYPAPLRRGVTHHPQEPYVQHTTRTFHCSQEPDCPFIRTVHHSYPPPPSSNFSPVHRPPTTPTLYHQQPSSGRLIYPPPPTTAQRSMSTYPPPPTPPSGRCRWPALRSPTP